MTATAERVLDHYAVSPQLLNDIVQVLEQIPGTPTRKIMNRIEGVGVDAAKREVTAVFKSDRLARAAAAAPPGKKKATRRGGGKVAKKKGGQ